jgi:hypothetical protein
VPEENWDFPTSEGHPLQISNKLFIGLGVDTRSCRQMGMTFERFLKTI